MATETEKKPEKKEPRYETRIVEGDYGNREDVGIATIRVDEYEMRQNHWVHLPDGQVRKWYHHRLPTEEDLDIIKSFDLLPTLKVSYRPITKFFNDLCEPIFLVWLLFLCGIVIDGVVVLFAEFFWKAGDVVIHHPWIYWLSSILVYGFIVTLVAGLVTLFFSSRYSENTRDDRIPREWWLEQERRKSENDI